MKTAELLYEGSINDLSIQNLPVERVMEAIRQVGDLCRATGSKFNDAIVTVWA